MTKRIVRASFRLGGVQEALLGLCQQGRHSLVESGESQMYLQRQLTRSATWSELADCRSHSVQFAARLQRVQEPYALGIDAQSSARKETSRRQRGQGSSGAAAVVPS